MHCLPIPFVNSEVDHCASSGVEDMNAMWMCGWDGQHCVPGANSERVALLRARAFLALMNDSAGGVLGSRTICKSLWGRRLSVSS